MSLYQRGENHIEKTIYLLEFHKKNICYSPGNTQAGKIRQHLGMEDYMIIWIWEKGIWRKIYI